MRIILYLQMLDPDNSIWGGCRSQHAQVNQAKEGDQVMTTSNGGVIGICFRSLKKATSQHRTHGRLPKPAKSSLGKFKPMQDQYLLGLSVSKERLETRHVVTARGVGKGPDGQSKLDPTADVSIPDERAWS